MKAIKLLIILMALFSFSSRAQEVESTAYDLLLKGLLSNSVQEISVQKAAKAQDALFVDSRERAEYEVSHIKDAVWVGYEELDLSKLEKVEKDKQIIIYCSVGYHSEKVAEKLKKKGFSNLSNLYGGIFEWKNQGFSVYDSTGVKTNRVHAYNKVWGVWLNKGDKVYNK